MRYVPGHQNRAAHVRRKPLAPLPDELSGPVRDFVAALRRMHGELGYSLKELESRLPASRSSLSRYLRGQSLPDERLLVQWCTLSLTGEDRLPALVELLHRAQESADAGAGAAARDTASDGETGTNAEDAPRAGREAGAAKEAGAGVATGGRRTRLLLAGLGTAAVLTAAALAVPALISSNGSPGGGSDDRAPGAKNAASAAGTARITVHNVERACQHRRTENCALGLARDPYRPYRRSNVVGHVWHGEVLRAVCRIANGITVTDEVGGHSSLWFRVEHKGEQVWMPAIRIRPEQVENTTLPGCPD
ncbi:helix-turn-helix domain-containing protein [Streptomyces tubercidicus]|uniref:helix-turn-helix domain-containing protein n=1 Tax=Streptomyces tubercidicus TaxID=47759 RepID=UPI001359993F|nr:helix-turn-helix transcriptional regulator [Streptomyces tubercidicus]WAU13148.1 helix-turn-helix transcriptional regulator [Streptomyces tubercidicus]